MLLFELLFSFAKMSNEYVRNYVDTDPREQRGEQVKPERKF